jgi:hypothetical protein
MTQKGFTSCGKAVYHDSELIADAVSPVHALLIVAALQWRRHNPVIHDGEVICSRCRSALPHEGHEPCVPKTPRCTETPDMFGGQDDEPESEVRKMRA